MMGTKTAENAERGKGLTWCRRALIAALVVLTILVANIASQQRLYFLLRRPFGSDVEATGTSPGGRYRTYFVSESGRSAPVLDVYLSRWFWLLPRHAVVYNYFSMSPPQVLRGPVRSGVVWSRDGRYLAATREGWFVECYDTHEDKQILFFEDPPDNILIGETPQETRALNPRYEEWASFHDQVERILEAHGGQVPDEIGYEITKFEPWIAALKDEEWHVRQDAALELAKRGDARAIEPLIAALKDEEPVVRFYAAEALGKLGDGRAVEALAAALKEEDEWVRFLAAEALGKLGDPRGVEFLIAALKDEDSWVRRKAAEALGELGDVCAVEPLEELLTDGDEDVGAAAKAALEKLRAKTPKP